MIVCEESYPAILDEIINFLTNSDVELIFVDSNEMRELNLKERNIDKATDVLSFPLNPVPNFPIGSIVINKDLVEQKAKELNNSNEEETTLLFIHGLLHVLGYDHEIDNGEMREKEKEIITKLNLPKSLIIRTEE